MSMLNLSRYAPAMEDFEEAPMAEAVVAVAEGDVVDPQIVTNADGVQGHYIPTDQSGEMPPAFVPLGGYMGGEAPEVSPLPAVELEIGAGPSGVEGELPAADFAGQAPGLIVDQVIDHDATMPMLERTVEEQSVIADSAGEVLEVREALEAYAGLLKQAGRDGISKQAAAFLAVGLKRCDRVISTTSLTLGMEHYDASPRSALQPAQVSLEDLREKIKAAAAQFLEWMKGLWAKAKQFAEHLSQGIVQLEHKLGQVEAKANELGSAAASKQPITVDVSKIAVNGKVSVSFNSELNGLAVFAAATYPQAVTKYYATLSSIVEGYDVASGQADAAVEALNTAKAPLDKLLSNTATLPGNMEVDIAADGVVYGMKQSESAADAPTEFKTVPRTGNALKQEITKMKGVLGNLKKIKSSQDTLSAGAAKLSEAVAALDKRLEGTDVDETSRTEGAKVASAAMGLIKSTNPRYTEIIKYVARTTSAYANLIQLELNGGGLGEKAGKVVDKAKGDAGKAMDEAGKAFNSAKDSVSAAGVSVKNAGADIAAKAKGAFGKTA